MENNNNVHHTNLNGLVGVLDITYYRWILEDVFEVVVVFESIGRTIRIWKKMKGGKQNCLRTYVSMKCGYYILSSQFNYIYKEFGQSIYWAILRGHCTSSGKDILLKYYHWVGVFFDNYIIMNLSIRCLIGPLYGRFTFPHTSHRWSESIGIGQQNKFIQMKISIGY